MHLALQLDWYPGNGNDAVRPSQMQVDWVRYYPVTHPVRRNGDEHCGHADEHGCERRLTAAPTGKDTGATAISPWPLPARGTVSGPTGGCGTRTAGRRCRSAG
jgi:hypothetical protein